VQGFGGGEPDDARNPEKGEDREDIEDPTGDD
jgi:hypothetical protein